jgi:hypothetical protein
MMRVANPNEPPIVIPVVVVAVDIHVALVIPTVERGENVWVAILVTALRVLSELNRIRHHNALASHTKYLHF